MKVYRFCQDYLLKNKLRFVLYLFICMILSVVMLGLPYITGGFIDSLVSHHSMNEIYRYCAVFLFIIILRLVLGYVQSMSFSRLNMAIAYDLNKDVVKHVQNMSVSYINHFDAAYLNQIINGDANTLIGFCLTSIQSVLANVITLLVPLVILYRINRILTLFLILVMVIYVGLYTVMKKPLYGSAFHLSESHSRFVSKLFEQFNLIKFIKTNSIQKEMHERLDQSFDDLLHFNLKNQKLHYLFVTLDTVASTTAQLFLFLYGGAQILAGKFTIGRFTMFSSYFSMMISSVKYFVNLSKSYQNVLVSYDRLLKIWNGEEESNGKNEVDHIQEVEIQDLDFTYGSKTVLSKVNLKMQMGKIYCIHGENGIGKSTLLHLIMGLYADEHSGDIRFNGCNIKDLDMVSLRKKRIGFSEQEPSLISGSFLYNLYFRDKIDPAWKPQVLDLAKLLGLERIIKNQEEGLHFTINERSNNLSGGEKQKISILRVLLKDPDLMILDEPTSAMDYGSVKRFMGYLNEIKKDKIILLVTHDEGVQDMCDCQFGF